MPMNNNFRRRAGLAVVMLTVVGACASDSANIVLVLGPHTRDGVRVKCAGDWRSESERHFSLAVTSDCHTTPSLKIHFYDELNNALTSPCDPPEEDARVSSLMAGREEQIDICRSLPRRSMEISVELHADCKPPSKAKVSARETCLVE